MPCTKTKQTGKSNRIPTANQAHEKTIQTKIITPVFNINPLQQKFEKYYNTLFLDHLDKVITQNHIAAELEKGILQSITTQTIQHLSSLDKPQQEIHQLYSKFFRSNEIKPCNLSQEVRKAIQNMEVPTTRPPKEALTLKNITRASPSTSIHITKTGQWNRQPQKDQKQKEKMYRATSKHKKKQAMFFRVKPANVKNTNLTIHNLSTFKLTTPDAQLLSRGLSFVPTPKVTPEKKTCRTTTQLQ